MAAKLRLEDGPGVIDVVLGRSDYRSAVQTPALMEPVGGIESADYGDRPGVLDVLVAGRPLPPSPSDFVSSSVVSELIGVLRESYDVVLVDTPPLIGSGDTLALSALVDTLVVVVRPGVQTRGAVDELRMTLAKALATITGVVANDVKSGDGQGYGSAMAPEHRNQFQYSELLGRRKKSRHKQTDESPRAFSRSCAIQLPRLSRGLPGFLEPASIGFGSARRRRRQCVDRWQRRSRRT